MTTVMTGLILCYALLARRMSFANLTAPMASIVAGMIVFSGRSIDVEAESVRTLAEIALVIILFHDASTVRLGQLRRDPTIPFRLLAIGFPLALLATYLVTWAMLPALGIAGALLIAAAITPTDAGLGAPTVLNPAVPLQVRRALNVESGLNDGLATPIVLFALGLLAERERTALPGLFKISATPVLLALVCAVVGGLLTAWALDRSRERNFSGQRGQQVAALALPILLFGIANLIGANVFIAAFVGGLVFGAASHTLAFEHETSSLLETSADLLGFIVWFIFGGLLLEVFAAEFHWQWVVLAVLALTVLRMAPVAVSMIGTGLRWPTIAFLGWFGPRGLATIMFGLLTFEELGDDAPNIHTINGVLAVTVLISVFAHGLSAGPLSRSYGRWASAAPTAGPGPLHDEPLLTRGRYHVRDREEETAR